MLDLQCCVCIQVYSDKTAPRNLGCGHCVCSTCVEEIIRVSPECPECRKKFKAKKATDLNINHTLMRLARMYAFATLDKDGGPPPELTITQPSAIAAESAGNCPLHGHMMFFMCLRCDVTICRDCLTSDHPDQPYGKCIIVSLKERTEKLKQTHMQTLNIYLELAGKNFGKFKQISKGSKIVIEYWEKQSQNETAAVENASMLEEVKAFHKQCEEDFEEIKKLKNDLIETKDRLKNAQYKEDILNLMEGLKQITSQLEELAAKKTEDKLFSYMDKFWRGQKFKIY